MLRRIVLASACLALLGNPATASDGVIEINQVAVFAGGITPGDAPGFPATLSLSASYRLTGTLDVTKNAAGGTQAGAENITAVLITASDATLDLNGFAIVGPVSCSGSPPTNPRICTPSSGTGRGVDAQNVEGVTVRNGAIRGMGDVGVRVGTGGHVESVRAADNGDRGIETGDSIVITNCSATGNGDSGISLLSGVVEGSVAFGNGDRGIRAVDATIKGNAVFNNASGGIFVTISGTVVGNTSGSNGGAGLNAPVAAGYALNTFDGNNGGNANPQVTGGTQMPPNVCGGDLTCP
jgi:hypothetical protein